MCIRDRLYRGLDGNIPELGKNEREKFIMYYVCAKEFGWDKKQVDSQPIEYLKKLLATHIDVQKKQEEEMNKAKRKNF